MRDAAKDGLISTTLSAGFVAFSRAEKEQKKGRV